MKRSDLEAMWKDDRNWRFYFTIYRCPADPRIFVRKRDTFGWTVNFSHKAALPIFALMLITIFLPFAILILWRDDSVGVASTLGLMALVVAVWVWISIRDERRGD